MRFLSRSAWTIAPIEGEHRTMVYVLALLKELAARDRRTGGNGRSLPQPLLLLQWQAPPGDQA